MFMFCSDIKNNWLFYYLTYFSTAKMIGNWHVYTKCVNLAYSFSIIESSIHIFKHALI